MTPDLDLAALIEIVEARVEAMPDISRTALRQDRSGRAADDLPWDLAVRHGAYCMKDRDSFGVEMAGIRATSTRGLKGALRNWCAAARRNISTGAQS